MPKYNYVLTNQTGEKRVGAIIASSLDAAKKQLTTEDNILISLTESKERKLHFWEKPRLSFQDRMMFTKHLSTMVKVGVTLVESMEILKSQSKNKSQKNMYQNIIDRIHSGQSLAQSLREYNYIFSEVFINMIETGEKSGNLEEVLKHLDKQIEKQYTLRKKIISALIYPAMIIGITLILAVGIMVFIMPKITRIFDSLDIELPFITEALIAFSDFLVTKPLISLLLVGGTISFFVTIFRLKILKPFFHKITLHIPVFGKLLIYSNLARFSRTLNSLLESGIPITNALKIIQNMFTNTLYKREIKDAHAKVEKGAQLGESLKSNEKLFPILTTKMLYIGEKTGSLEVATARLAELYEHEVDSLTKNLSVLLEPLLLVFMAALVGGMAMAIILPLYQLPNLLS